MSTAITNFAEPEWMQPFLWAVRDELPDGATLKTERRGDLLLLSVGDVVTAADPELARRAPLSYGRKVGERLRPWVVQAIARPRPTGTWSTEL